MSHGPHPQWVAPRTADAAVVASSATASRPHARAATPGTGASWPGIRRVWALAGRFLGMGPTDRTGLEAASQSGFGWLGALSIWAAVALMALAFANNASLRGEEWANTGVWVAIAALVWPFAARMVRPDVGERELISLVVVLGMALYLVRILHNPMAFVNHDEFLHWRNVENILASGALFTTNPLLPISSLYPGMALVTAALVQLTGLSVFAAGALLIGVARLVFILCAYALFRSLSASARIAAGAALIVMASSNFVFFHSQFSYESLAIALVVLCLAAAVRITADGATGFVAKLPLLLVPMLGLAMTHHLSAYFLVVVLALVTVAALLIDRQPGQALRYAILTSLSLAILLGWQSVMGNPTGDYMGPILGKAWGRIGEIVASGTLGRKLFVSAAGDVLPLWQRIVAVASVALIGGGLLTGTLRVWFLREPRQGAAWPAVMMFLAATYPLFVAMRFEPLTWEIGNRVGTYVFLAVAYVAAYGVVTQWQGRSTGVLRTAVVASAMTVLVIGGVVAGFGPQVQPGPYLVGGENRAVEAQGIHAAQWTRKELGRDHVVAGDRTNRLLASVYGHQRVVTSLHDRLDVSPLFLAPTFGKNEQRIVDQARIEYILVDRRLSLRLPWVGHYFEGHESPGGHKSPASPGALNKFDGMPFVNRVYDNGDIAIYDLRGLHGRP